VGGGSIVDIRFVDVHRIHAFDSIKDSTAFSMFRRVTDWTTIRLGSKKGLPR
jgi:hypothetical protein